MTNIKLISELSKDELKLVFDKNSKLQYNILDDMIDNEMFWISEYLDYFRHTLDDWSIGTSNHNYIKVNMERMKDFVEGVKTLQEDTCLLIESENGFINEVLNKVDEYYNLDVYSDDFEEFEEEVKNLVVELSDKIVQQFNKNLNYVFTKENQFDYFINFYIDERLSGDEYINLDDGDYILYKNEIKNFS